MTSPQDIRRYIARVHTNATVLEGRLANAVENINRKMADSLPTTASGSASGPQAKGSVSDPTPAAAHANLGDLYGYTNTYRPGPLTQLDDLADNLRAALMALDMAQSELTRIGVAPFTTEQYRCRGINGTGCHDWADRQRTDHLCIDCGRRTDSDARRRRRHQQGVA